MTEYGLHHTQEVSEDDPRQIDVDISKWKRGTDDAILFTDGIDTCIGVGILDPYSQVGHLGHFADPTAEVAEIDKMLASAVENVTDRDRLLVWARGGADPIIKDGTTRTRLSQNLIVRRLAAFGLRKPDIKWGGDTGFCFSMRLHCAIGTCAIEEIEW